ncbi:MAG: hypothetical protein AAB332_01570 [Planctomycetota bacterium]
MLTEYVQKAMEIAHYEIVELQYDKSPQKVFASPIVSHLKSESSVSLTKQE